MQQCTKCELSLPLDCFSKSSRHKSGKHPSCKSCMKGYLNNWRERNPEKVQKHNEKFSVYSNQWYKDNRDTVLENHREYKKNNKSLINAHTAIRRKRVQMHTPSWVDRAQLLQIYLNRPEGHHVDHIVPLNHPKVCGLHVPWNLQYLPAKENLMKSNHLLDTMK